ncbi:MAG: hypothetical protein O7H41_04910 [Planctomycetota bacterium]|nr:hypothetical protein [Planctomycetota bacterium]
METTVARTEDLTDQKEFMSLADAVANCQVKAKKTIVRWAKMDGIRERYGRTSTSTLERVVPIDWVKSKLEERGIEGEPIYESVELIENVSFTRQESTSALGSKVPALFQEQDQPQLLVFFDRMRRSQDAQAIEVRKLIHESRSGRDMITRAVQEGQNEGRKEIVRFRRFQNLVNVAICMGVVLLGAGLSFVIHLGFELNASRAEDTRSLRSDLAGKISSQERALRDELMGVKQFQRENQIADDLEARELKGLRDGIRILREDLFRREDALVEMFRSKDTELTEVKARLDTLKSEKDELAHQIQFLSQTPPSAAPGE